MMFKWLDDWYRLDTGAALYSTLNQSARPFDVTELNAYDHLFCGTHASLFTGATFPVEERYLQRFRESHVATQQNRDSLKGAWRWQQDLFESLRCDSPDLPNQGKE
jgi:hypothetical protein